MHGTKQPPDIASGPVTSLFNGPHPIHISKSAIVALTLPLVPSAICRVMNMGAPQRRARNAAWDSLSGGWTSRNILELSSRLDCDRRQPARNLSPNGGFSDTI